MKFFVFILIVSQCYALDKFSEIKATEKTIQQLAKKDIGAEKNFPNSDILKWLADAKKITLDFYPETIYEKGELITKITKNDVRLEFYAPENVVAMRPTKIYSVLGYKKIAENVRMWFLKEENFGSTYSMCSYLRVKQFVNDFTIESKQLVGRCA